MAHAADVRVLPFPIACIEKPDWLRRQAVPQPRAEQHRPDGKRHRQPVADAVDDVLHCVEGLAEGRLDGRQRNLRHGQQRDEQDERQARRVALSRPASRWPAPVAMDSFRA